MGIGIREPLHMYTGERLMMMVNMMPPPLLLLIIGEIHSLSSN
jgi:hypothetical protein